ncbi:beta-N-acetylhexosaminidase [Persicirhabdus sediminis]|uniref:beta-N-acetylhexosaminidase n=1 Tax=Persicirhabdus sediminis TaxID=454144 RepID=A0A8J7MEJ3_9BACT|nr:beta-N-acetylhexosaminidase [Persicirhabdus sediminis]MBK1791068.1 beta-N-acetylhexosaminidase [Persicirhabdus sediminis]
MQSDHGQLMILGVPGTELTAADIELYQRIQPGGFILFGRNVESPEQLAKLTADLLEVTDEKPIIAIDQEGGRVTRTKEIGHAPPSAQELRENGDLGMISWHGLVTGDVLRVLGFNMNFAPVLDISYDDAADNALRGRCYGKDAQEVITNAGIFNRNMRRRKINSCGKHFPSCGLSDCDPHHGLPVIDKTIDEMMKSDLLPYNALMPEMDAIMTCHAHFSAVDGDQPGLPGSFSKKIVTHLLRWQLGYEGLIITDDLDMGAIVDHYGRGPDVEMAIRAGNDMVMICHQIDSAEQALEQLKKLPDSVTVDSLKRIKKFKKKRLPKKMHFNRKQWDKLDAETLELRKAVLGDELALNPELASQPVNSPVEEY